MDNLTRLRVLAPDEAVDARNIRELLYVDRCTRCQREFLMHLHMPHRDSCDSHAHPAAPAPRLPWWKRLFSQ